MSEQREEGLRFNKNKVRHDLLEPFAINELAKVFSAGSLKYEDHNWLKGMKWSSVLSSLKRHINAFEQGEDMDPELGTYHMANAAWNALALVSYYKHYPQGDDRIHTKLKKNNISLDVDDVCCDFIGGWCDLYQFDKPTSWLFDPLMGDRLNKMSANGTLDDFSINLPCITNPEDIHFTPVAYVTARGDRSKKVTEDWLRMKGFPFAPVHCTNNKSKVDILKELNVDIHVDDNYNTFQELNANGIFCYLFDTEHNRKYDVGHKRIYSLKDLR